MRREERDRQEERERQERERRRKKKDRVFSLQECEKKEDGKSEGEKADKEKTERNESVPKKSLISNLIMWYLEHQKEQIIKAISRTNEKEVTIDVGGKKVSIYRSRIYFT